ncbi:FAD binding domain-containing protein [Janibacter terrae]|uniref:FAD binding domain-containing protein n=1 Tax=Janibacter terrae TaxID=103817 RepID=UPI0008344C69|nr:xanthine dehydrogenase family protein subunit M [Janibacter terrae]
MKPPPFDYEAPVTLDEVLELLRTHEDGAVVLAGGQSLVPLLNMRFARPDVVVDLNRVTGLDDIVVTPDAVTLGAMVRLTTIERDEQLAQALPVLAEAASWVAHPQIRCRTTVGGTLCHADPSAEMPTVAVALGATMHLRSADASREVPAEDFFDTVFTTTKAPDELLVSVVLPRRAGWSFHYDEIAQRHGDFPYAGLCLGVDLRDGVIVDVRAAAAGVSDTPQRLHALEDTLRGQAVGSGAEAAAEAAAGEVDPPDDAMGSSAFRRSLLRTLVRRQLSRLEEVDAA